MDQVTYKELLEDVVDAAIGCRAGGLAMLGDADICNRLVADLEALGETATLGPVARWHEGKVLPADSVALAGTMVEVVVIASDRDKEMMVRALPSLVSGRPRVLLAGYRHLEFRDDIYDCIIQRLTEPSLANGYPHSRIHLYQCLQNAVRLQLEGVIVEFGMFRGGTTQFLAETALSLGVNYPIIGLDTFGGFPDAQHIFDMYSHPDLFEIDIAEVKSRLHGYNIEIVPGDIVTTAGQALHGKAVVLAFVDTDNYSSGQAAIRAVMDQVVVGGAIVLDHYTGVDRFKRTLGERLAAQDLLVDDPRYFNLHGTGVFLRQSAKRKPPSIS